MKKFISILIMVGLLLVAVPSYAAYTLSAIISDQGDGFATIALTVTLGADDDSAEEISMADIKAAAAATYTRAIRLALNGMLLWVSADPGTGGAAPSTAVQISWYTRADALKIPVMAGYATDSHIKVEVADGHSVEFMDVQNDDYFLLNDFGSTGDSYTLYIGVIHRR